MNTAAWPSPVNVAVRSVPHIVSTVSGMMVPSWLRGPRGEPTRARRQQVVLAHQPKHPAQRGPDAAQRNRAQTLRWPSPWNGLAASTARIAAAAPHPTSARSVRGAVAVPPDGGVRWR